LVEDTIDCEPVAGEMAGAVAVVTVATATLEALLDSSPVPVKGIVAAEVAPSWSVTCATRSPAEDGVNPTDTAQLCLRNSVSS
jgi:hypothetical protein